MRKNLRFILLTLLCAVFTSAWAEEVTDVLDRALTGVTGTSYVEWSGKTATSDAVYAGQSAGGNSSIQLRSNNNNSGIITTASGGKIKSITVTWNSNTTAGRTLNIYGSNTAYTATTDLYDSNKQGTLLGSIVKGTSTSLEVEGNYTFIGIRSNKDAMYIDKIEIVWEASSSPTVPAPTFDPPAGTYYSDSGSYTIEVSCEDGDATIYYTTDGTNPTTDSDFFEGGNGFITIRVGAPVTVKAMAVDEDENFSRITSATYTIKELTSFENLAELASQTEADTYLVDPLDAVVTYVNGNNAYIEDASGAILLFKEGHGLTAGTTINGPAIVEFQLRNGNPQITNIDLSECEVEEDEIPDPEEVAISDWDYDFDTNILSRYFKVTGAEITKKNNKYYIQLGSDEVQLYGQGEAKNFTIEDLNDTYTIVGFPTLYVTSSNTTKELVIYEKPLAEGTNVVPSINAEKASIELAYDATSGEIAYTITNPVSGKSLQATSSADWISNITVSDDKVTFSTTTNEGEANRTATITLSYEGAESVTVTVTQKFYVIDYATLPFAFDGGKADIDGTAGLTQSGLGTDYNASPKLKFDHTGDELILKINERPGKLTFNIKGNGFSGGTFTLQASADGTTYSEVKSYTTLSDQNETITDLDADVRYIKWIYTTKASGNVGLGNIKLDKYNNLISPEIVFEENEFTAVYGEPFTAPALNNPYGVTVTYSSSDETIASVDSETGEVTLNGAEGTVIITASSEEDETYEAGSTSYTITVTVPAADTDDVFELVSTNDLAEGDEIIIVNVKEQTTPADEETGTEESTTYTYMGLGADKGNNRDAVSVTANEDGTLNGNNKLQVITLEVATKTDAETNEVTKTDNWWLNVGNGYLYAASSTKNQLKTEVNPDDDGNADASISINDGIAGIIFKGTNTRNILKFNSSNNPPLFSCYASGQDDVKIYRKIALVPGDANGDGKVTVADVMMVVNHILGNSSSNINLKNADVNNDGGVNVTDVMGIVKIILQN